MSQLVTPSFLFRFSFPVLHLPNLPNRAGRLLDLPEQCRLPSLSELDGLRHFADVRVVWNASGFGISVDVRGRTKPINPKNGDTNQLSFWIDTRNTQGVHRLTKFCHHFQVSPTGGRPKLQEATAVQVLPQNSRETDVPQTSEIQVKSELEQDGYHLEAWLPASVFVGFDPSLSPRLGFHYSMSDSELGEQCLATGETRLVATNPSLWQTLELVE